MKAIKTGSTFKIYNDGLQTYDQLPAQAYSVRFDEMSGFFLERHNDLEIKEDKKKEVERKIFPGYVMIKMIVTDDSWYVVRNIRGCTGFVGPASKPVPLTDEEVAALGVEKHSVEVGYKEGDNVKIISGPLEGYTGTVKTVDTANNNVCVVLSMFGRETPVELELDQISLAD